MNQSVEFRPIGGPCASAIYNQSNKNFHADSLKSIYEHLEESYTHEEIKLVRAWWRRIVKA